MECQCWVRPLGQFDGYYDRLLERVREAQRVREQRMLFIYKNDLTEARPFVR